MIVLGHHDRKVRLKNDSVLFVFIIIIVVHTMN